MFEVLEEGGVEAGVVPVFSRFAFEGVLRFGGNGVFFVVDVLGEDEESRSLLKGAVARVLMVLVCQSAGALEPVVGGGADGVVGVPSA